MINKDVYISGYWQDTGDEFSDYKCRIGLDVEDDDDDNIFYYFNSMKDLESFYDDSGVDEFVITKVEDSSGRIIYERDKT